MEELIGDPDMHSRNWRVLERRLCSRCGHSQLDHDYDIDGDSVGPCTHFDYDKGACDDCPGFVLGEVLKA